MEYKRVRGRMASNTGGRDQPGAAFTKYFHNSSTIFPSTILPQDNPDAPNEEELWKNCRNFLQARAAGKNCGRIVEKL
jgi:hypothetical protein